MMDWHRLITRLAPPLLVATVLALAVGASLTALLIIIISVTTGVVVSELATPWLTHLTARALARGRIVDVSYEAYITTTPDALERLREELVQVEGELPSVLARENIQVSSTRPVDNGVAFEGSLIGGYNITGSITLATGARNQARVVVTLTARSVPYRRLPDVLDTLFFAAIGGNRAIRDLLHEHGITGMVKGRVVITTRGRPSLLDYVPRGFRGFTLTKSFGVKEYKISMSYDAANHTGYLIIDGPWGYVEEIIRELLPLYT